MKNSIIDCRHCKGQLSCEENEMSDRERADCIRAAKKQMDSINRQGG
jgi:hypothetical protein